MYVYMHHAVLRGLACVPDVDPCFQGLGWHRGPSQSVQWFHSFALRKVGVKRRRQHGDPFAKAETMAIRRLFLWNLWTIFPCICNSCWYVLMVMLLKRIYFLPPLRTGFICSRIGDPRAGSQEIPFSRNTEVFPWTFGSIGSVSPGYKSMIPGIGCFAATDMKTATPFVAHTQQFSGDSIFLSWSIYSSALKRAHFNGPRADLFVISEQLRELYLQTNLAYLNILNKIYKYKYSWIWI